LTGEQPLAGQVMRHDIAFTASIASTDHAHSPLSS
jgi:hypothetical protein